MSDIIHLTVVVTQDHIRQLHVGARGKVRRSQVVSQRDVQFGSTACFIFSVRHLVGPHSSSSPSHGEHDVSELISSIVVVQGPQQNQASDPHWVLTFSVRPSILCSDPAVSAPRQAADTSTRAAQLSRPLGRRRHWCRPHWVVRSPSAQTHYLINTLLMFDI